MADAIHEADCLSVRDLVKDNSVDLIMTSPPYGMRRKETYGGIPADEYVEWFLPRAAQFMAVLKPTGSFVLNIKEHCEDGQRSTYVLRLVLALKEQGWRWTDEFIWHKPNPMPGSWNGRLKDGWEHCFHFTKAKGHKFNPDAVRKPLAEQQTGQAHPCNSKGRTEKFTKSGFGFSYGKHNEREAARAAENGGILTALPSNVVSAPLKPHKKHHPATFPEALPEFFIKLMTDMDDLVLDPFCGSGTTCEVAKRLGRRWIGLDVNKEYVELARQRLAESML